MSDIQYIPLSQRQKKKVLKSINDDSVIYQDENGDLIVSAVAYEHLKLLKGLSPIEDALKDTVLDADAKYYVLT